MKELVERVCQGCYIGFYHQHSEQPEIWYKCSLCGHCIKQDLDKRKKLIEKQSIKEGFMEDPKNIKISKYFTLDECTYLPSWNTHHILSDKELENVKKFALVMDKVREFFDKPCNVHVWIRPICLNNPDSDKNGKNYNSLVNGAPKSAHIVGLACDFDIEGMECDEVRKQLLPKLDELGLRMEDKPHSNWVHLDIKDLLPGGKRFFKP